VEGKEIWYMWRVKRSVGVEGRERRASEDEVICNICHPFV
jgi:hypothetical protein